MLVLAADHIINNQPVFHDAIRVAEQYADEGHLVTFGIVPNAPETGYGYIQRGVALTGSAHTPYQVARFVEKPDRERAEAYLASGEYYWNSGMFMFSAAMPGCTTAKTATSTATRSWWRPLAWRTW